MRKQSLFFKIKKVGLHKICLWSELTKRRTVHWSDPLVALAIPAKSWKLECYPSGSNTHFSSPTPRNGGNHREVGIRALPLVGLRTRFGTHKEWLPNRHVNMYEIGTIAPASHANKVPRRHPGYRGWKKCKYSSKAQPPHPHPTPIIISYACMDEWMDVSENHKRHSLLYSGSSESQAQIGANVQNYNGQSRMELIAPSPRPSCTNIRNSVLFVIGLVLPHFALSPRELQSTNNCTVPHASDLLHRLRVKWSPYTTPHHTTNDVGLGWVELGWFVSATAYAELMCFCSSHLHKHCIGFLFSPPLHVWKTGCFRVAAPLSLQTRLRKRAFPILGPPYITFLSRVAYKLTSTIFCLNRKPLFSLLNGMQSRDLAEFALKDLAWPPDPQDWFKKKKKIGIPRHACVTWHDVTTTCQHVAHDMRHTVHIQSGAVAYYINAIESHSLIPWIRNGIILLLHACLCFMKWHLITAISHFCWVGRWIVMKYNALDYTIFIIIFFFGL